MILSLPFRVLEDEIQQLRDQLRETVDENGRLYKLLKERDFEIKHLKKKIEEDRFAFTGSASCCDSPCAEVLVNWPSSYRTCGAGHTVGSKGQYSRKSAKGQLWSGLSI